MLIEALFDKFYILIQIDFLLGYMYICHVQYRS